MQLRLPIYYRVEFTQTNRSAEPDGKTALFQRSSYTHTSVDQAKWVTLTIPEVSSEEAPVTLAYRPFRNGRPGGDETVEVRLRGQDFYRPLTRWIGEFAYLADFDEGSYREPGREARHIDIASGEAIADMTSLLNATDAKDLALLSRMADQGGPDIPADATVEKSGRGRINGRILSMQDRIISVDGKLYEMCDEPRVIVYPENVYDPPSAENAVVMIGYGRQHVITTLPEAHFHFDESAHLSSLLRSLGWDYSVATPDFRVVDPVAYAGANAETFLVRSVHDTVNMAAQSHDYLADNDRTEACMDARSVFYETARAETGLHRSPANLAATLVAWGRFNDEWCNGGIDPGPKPNVTDGIMLERRRWLLLVSLSLQTAAFERWSRRYPAEFLEALAQRQTARPKKGLIRSALDYVHRIAA